jgi:hypothetical protein
MGQVPCLFIVVATLSLLALVAPIPPPSRGTTGLAEQVMLSSRGQKEDDRIAPKPNKQETKWTDAIWFVCRSFSQFF